MKPLLGKKEQDEVSAFLEEGLANSSTNVQLVTFEPTEGECEACESMKQLYSEIAALSKGKLTTKSVKMGESKDLIERYNVKRGPATVVTSDGSGSGPALKFYGLPSGYEFSALLQDIVDVANKRPSSLSETTIQKMGELKSKVHIQVFVTPTCPYCPMAVRTAHQLSMVNPEMIDAEMVESMEFPELSEKYSVMAVPKIVINENVEFEGALPEHIFLSKIQEAISA